MGHADRCVTGIPQKSSKRWMRMRMSRLLRRSSTRHLSMEHSCRWIPTTLTTGVLASMASLKLECYLSEHTPICTSVSKLLYPHARIFPPLSPPLTPNSPTNSALAKTPHATPSSSQSHIYRPTATNAVPLSLSLSGTPTPTPKATLNAPQTRVADTRRIRPKNSCTGGGGNP